MFSDLPLRIDENRVDLDSLPRDYFDSPYFPNTGTAWSHLIFAIPITIGE
ncbi:MAG: hypothetical protein FWB76_01720 [Oscillospiraceae bacterium]|nr:hypothetical protein [Oscillospiraceae bacterium]